MKGNLACFHPQGNAVPLRDEALPSLPATANGLVVEQIDE
jgi:hypothetical protein